MSYSFDNNTANKWDTIQEDVADMYLEDVEEAEEEEEDFFGFSKAIQIDHLTDEQVDELLTNIEWGA
jgi:predicted GTPase